MPPIIGVFDSGIGGLTVLSKLIEAFPHRSFIYYADTAHLPYGNKTSLEITEYALSILDWFESQAVKKVVIACNTSCSALIYDGRLPSNYSFDISGTIEPTVEYLFKKKYKKIAVIATPLTTKNGAYEKALIEKDPNVHVYSIACPDLVPLIESDSTNPLHIQEALSQYLKPVLSQNIETLVYGCTHYPFLSQWVQTMISPHIEIVDPAVHVANFLKDKKSSSLQPRLNYSYDRVRFVVSGDPEIFARRASFWIGFKPKVEKIPLVRSHHSIGVQDQRISA